VRRWLIQLWWTQRTVLARRRTYIGFGAIVLFDLVVLGMMQSENLRDAARHFYLRHPRFASPENFSGLTIAHFVLSQSVILLGSLYLALVAGDIVAKEVEDGTMGMTLCRPISRARILCLRWIACTTYTFALVFFLAGMALICGLIDQGSGNLLVFFPGEKIPALHAFEPGLARYALAVPFQAISLLTITALGFMFSCCRMKPIAATVATLSIYLADSFLHTAPFFRALKPYFITTHMDEWIQVYRPEIPWDFLLRNCALLLSIDLALLALGWWVFRRRDLKP